VHVDPTGGTESSECGLINIFPPFLSLQDLFPDTHILPTSPALIIQMKRFFLAKPPQKGDKSRKAASFRDKAFSEYDAATSDKCETMRCRGYQRYKIVSFPSLESDPPPGRRVFFLLSWVQKEYPAVRNPIIGARDAEMQNMLQHLPFLPVQKREPHMP